MTGETLTAGRGVDKIPTSVRRCTEHGSSRPARQLVHFVVRPPALAAVTEL
jgi:hypothetical protein